MSSHHPVYIIDDDLDVCRSLTLLLSAEGYAARSYLSGEHFLLDLPQLAVGTVVSDVCMPGVDGLQLLEGLRSQRRYDPVVLITGHADVPLAVRALRNGAYNFIEKPFASEEIVCAVGEALASLSGGRDQDLLERVQTLSKREREVLEALIEGATNKRIALDLGISPRTVEIYRANLMEKMQATSLSRLVRMGLEAGLQRHAPMLIDIRAA